MSILSGNTVVKKSTSNGVVTLKRGNVTGVLYDMLGANFSSAKKFMFEDGIEWISSFNGTEASAVEEVSLPSTLKVLESSFNCMPRLKGVTLPSQIVSVLDSFWADYAAVGNYQYPLSEKTYDFTVAIPDGVTNVVRLPANVTFGKNSAFTRDENDGRIYKVDGSNKILVSEYQHNVGADGTLEIPSGVTALQVGMLYGLDYTSLKLPATVKKPNYNVSASVVPGYLSATNNYKGGRLYRSNALKDPAGASAGHEWYAVEQKLGGEVKTVMFDTTSVPSGFASYNFVSASDYYDSTDYTDLAGYPVVCVKEIAAGKAVTVNIHGYSNMDKTFNKSYTDKKLLNSGDKLTKDKIAEVMGLNDLGYEYKITMLNELDKQFDETATVTRNIYVTLEIEYAKTGILYEGSKDGSSIIVTGFDKANAQKLSDTDELYLVNIPAEIDGKPVTEIAANAFEGEESVYKVYIKNSVKTIGSYAFTDTANLTYVEIQPGGLETVASYAFANAGCYELDGEVVKNADLKIVLPLANLKTLEPYAFKTPAITQFLNAEGEEDRYLFGFPSSESYVYKNLKAGDFFFVRGGAGNNYGIIRYVSTSVAKKTDEKGDVDVNVYDVRYVATAGGYKGGSDQLTLGYSYRPWASFYPVVGKYVMRYEVMEGSVYHLFYHTMENDGDTDRSFNYINIGIVSKIHANAFTDMGLDKIVYYSKTYDSWIEREQITSQDPTIFEEGWWQGISNETMKEKLADIAESQYDSTLS